MDELDKYEKEMVLDGLKELHEQFVEEDDLHYSVVVAKAIKIIEGGNENHIRV